MLKRTFDIVLSSAGLLVLSPVLLLLAAAVGVESKGGIFYRQRRVGRYGREFTMLKFRTMRPGSDKAGLLTIGKDPRITRTGRFLRKYKLDELPQLFNVLQGTMSLVGPRPEVKRYVDLYDEDQRKVLEVKPGITDPASLLYFEENDLLARSNDPERTYIQEVMPAKLAINRRYISSRGLLTDAGIILRTLLRIVGRSK